MPVPLFRDLTNRRLDSPPGLFGSNVWNLFRLETQMLANRKNCIHNVAGVIW
jgi:hypothetical protein